MNTGNIVKIFEKPQNHETESTQAMIGKFIVTKQVFDTLESMASGRDGRITIAEALNVALKNNTSIAACKIEGKRFDVGDKSEYIAASIHYALKRDDMRSKILAYIQPLVNSQYFLMKNFVDKNFESSIETLVNVLQNKNLDSKEASIVLPLIGSEKIREIETKLVSIHQNIKHLIIIGIG